MKAKQPSYDCLLLAGTNRDYVSLDEDTPKALLHLGGKPLIQHIISALMETPQVRHIYVVGPAARLQADLMTILSAEERAKTTILAQSNDIITNILNSYQQMAAGKTREPILILPADTPFLQSSEVMQFCEKADMEHFDFVSNLTPAYALEPFYPTPERQGIKMAYFHHREGLYRIGNLHLARPMAVKNLEYLKKIYRLRYLKKWSNLATLSFELMKLAMKYPSGLFLFLSLVLSRYANLCHLNTLSRWLRFYASWDRCGNNISRLLKTRYCIVETTLGSAALDVDNLRDYHIMVEQFEPWSDHFKKRNDEQLAKF
jgi:molybdopterin-guanine dinucleotide biosynthesis protein A